MFFLTLPADAQLVGIRPGLITPVGNLIDHGGPIVAEPNVYIIWYGNWNRANNTDTPAGQQIVRDFLNALGGSPYFAINTTYSTTNTTITGAVTFAGEMTDPGSQGKLLTDAHLLAVITNAFVSNSLPRDPNGVYFVLSSSDIYETSGFCTRFCGFHKHAIFAGADIRYAFVGNAARCLRQCAAQAKGPNGNAGVDGMVSIIAHELSEATTDPDSTAWFDARRFENADRCVWTYGRHQYHASNGAWANIGWDFLDSNGAVLYHRDYLIQRNLVRVKTKTGVTVSFCATAYDPASGRYAP
jgi:hypothetical protein